jgi:hypothetical protein
MLAWPLAAFVSLSLLTTQLSSITRMRENCLKEFEAHWNCLEHNNHAYNLCRKQERPLNNCMFEKLVSLPLAIRSTMFDTRLIRV